jgi:hypothetical protein
MKLSSAPVQPAAQIPQGLLHRTATATPASQRSACPKPERIQAREQTQREQEIHLDRRGQLPQPALHGSGLLQDLIDQLEGQVLGQLAETGANTPAATVTAWVIVIEADCGRNGPLASGRS